MSPCDSRFTYDLHFSDSHRPCERKLYVQESWSLQVWRFCNFIFFFLFFFDLLFSQKGFFDRFECFGLVPIRICFTG